MTRRIVPSIANLRLSLITADQTRATVDEFPVRFKKAAGLARPPRASRGGVRLNAARPKPMAHRAAIDVDKIRSRIIADAARPEAQRRIAHLLQAAPFAAQIDGHPLDVIAVFGNPIALPI